MKINNEYLYQFSTEDIIDSLPENYPLYKDSGTWEIRTDDMKKVIFSQSIGQTFTSFIHEYILYAYERFTDYEKEKFQMDLASKSPLLNFD